MLWFKTIEYFFDIRWFLTGRNLVKTQLGAEVNEKDKNHKNDHNHHRQEKLATADQSESMQLTSIAKNKDATKKDTPESTNNKKLSPA